MGLLSAPHVKAVPLCLVKLIISSVRRKEVERKKWNDSMDPLSLEAE